MTPDIRQIICKIKEANVHSIASRLVKTEEGPTKPTFDKIATSVLCATPNSEILLECVVNGTGPFEFQWFHTPIHYPKEIAMSGERHPWLRLRVNNLSEAGLYRCLVINPYCPAGVFGPRFAIKVMIALEMTDSKTTDAPKA